MHLGSLDATACCVPAGGGAQETAAEQLGNDDRVLFRPMKMLSSLPETGERAGAREENASHQVAQGCAGAGSSVAGRSGHSFTLARKAASDYPPGGGPSRLSLSACAGILCHLIVKQYFRQLIVEHATSASNQVNSSHVLHRASHA